MSTVAVVLAVAVVLGYGFQGPVQNVVFITVLALSMGLGVGLLHRGRGGKTAYWVFFGLGVGATFPLSFSYHSSDRGWDLPIILLFVASGLLAFSVVVLLVTRSPPRITIARVGSVVAIYGSAGLVGDLIGEVEFAIPASVAFGFSFAIALASAGTLERWFDHVADS